VRKTGSPAERFQSLTAKITHQKKEIIWSRNFQKSFAYVLKEKFKEIIFMVEA
jgi:hypothetical protein